MGPEYGKPKSHAIWARTPIGKAVVFIHGYSGDAMATWSEFDKLIPETPEFAGWDFIFYGYDGLLGTTVPSAALFYEFLDRLFTQTETLTIPSLGRKLGSRPGFTFSRVILAAHSLGAVICRRALLSGRNQKRDWMNKTAMVLYAPAHLGALASDQIRELGVGPTWLSEMLRILGCVARHASPLIDELDPESDVLQDLLKDTNDALAQGDSPYLIAHKVVIAACANALSRTGGLPGILIPPPGPAPLTLRCASRTLSSSSP